MDPDWRCISDWKWGYSIAMLVYWRVEAVDGNGGNFSFCQTGSHIDLVSRKNCPQIIISSIFFQKKHVCKVTVLGLMFLNVLSVLNDSNEVFTCFFPTLFGQNHIHIHPRLFSKTLIFKRQDVIQIFSLKRISTWSAAWSRKNNMWVGCTNLKRIKEFYLHKNLRELFLLSKSIYPVIWKILGLFSSPISREIDHP